MQCLIHEAVHRIPTQLFSFNFHYVVICKLAVSLITAEGEYRSVAMFLSVMFGTVESDLRSPVWHIICLIHASTRCII